MKRIIRKGLPSLKGLRFGYVAKKVGDGNDDVWAKKLRTKG